MRELSDESLIIEDRYVTDILTNCTSDDKEANGIELSEILRSFLCEMEFRKLVCAVDAVKKL